MNQDEKEIKIGKSLEVCKRVALHLKEQFPNQIMKIKDNTIIDFSKKNSRLIHNGRRRGRNSMSGCNAYFTIKTPHRVVIKQKCLTDNVGWGWDGSNYYSRDPKMENGHKLYYHNPNVRNNEDLAYGVDLEGDIALIELMCHEFAHNRTSGHAKSFKIKYKRFWDFMKSEILNGNFKVSDKDLEHLKDVINELTNGSNWKSEVEENDN